VTDYRQIIRQRMGDPDAEYLYHGALPDAVGDILDDRAIRGETVDVYHADATDDEIADLRGRDITDADVFDSQYAVSLTGGFSDSLAGAMKFAQSLSRLGVLLVFETDGIDAGLFPVEYDLSWFDANAGALARVDTLTAGEVRTTDDEKIIALTREDGVIDTAPRENVEFTATSSVYSEENEFLAHGDRVRFDGALVGAITVAHTSRALGGSVQGALAEYPGYRMGFASGTDEDITQMDNREMATALANILRRDSGIDMEVDLPYYVVLADDDRWTQDGGLDRSSFILASDGQRIAETPADLPEWVPI
jgi:hypothetical protein